jgi:hypothetical protein
MPNKQKYRRTNRSKKKGKRATSGKQRATSGKQRATSGKQRATSGKRATGGRAIDAGSYGCVFDPALKCLTKNNTSHPPYDKNFISKLMYKEDAKAELDEMVKVKQYITKIPNADKYFLLSNTYVCNPDKLDNNDLANFNDKCGLFTKRNIMSENVNDNLNKLALLNMPNGGLSVEKTWTKMLADPKIISQFIKINNSLIELLKNGIVPLNKFGFHHYDVKSANILFGSDGYSRLIDWGLAGANDGKIVPEIIIDRSIAFNMPFSDIFFNNFVKSWLPEAIQQIKASGDLFDKKAGQEEMLKIIAVNIINKSMRSTSEGHFEYVTGKILHDIYKIYASSNKYNRLDYNILSYNVIVEYIVAVLKEFADENGNFNDVKYYYEVFVHNVDIWGWIMTYSQIIEESMGRMPTEVMNGLCRLFLKYCFSPEFAIKPIVLADLIADFTSLNTIAGKAKSSPSLIPTNNTANILKTNNMKMMQKPLYPVNIVKPNLSTNIFSNNISV